MKRLIPASGPASENPDNVKRLIFCTGKVYYDFMKTIKEKTMEDKIAVARIEQVTFASFYPAKTRYLS